MSTDIVCLLMFCLFKLTNHFIRLHLLNGIQSRRDIFPLGSHYFQALCRQFDCLDSSGSQRRCSHENNGSFTGPEVSQYLRLVPGIRRLESQRGVHLHVKCDCNVGCRRITRVRLFCSPRLPSSEIFNSSSYLARQEPLDG